MPSPKTSRRKPSRRSAPRASHGGRPARQSTLPPVSTLPILPTLFTEEWWSSWRRANAAGWDYLNAVSGLVRLPFNALGFPPPFPRP